MVVTSFNSFSFTTDEHSAKVSKDLRMTVPKSERTSAVYWIMACNNNNIELDTMF